MTAHEDRGPPRRSDDDVDALYRAGSPAPADEATLERIAASVSQRLEARRKRRRRAQRWAAVAAAAAAAVLVAGILVWEPFSPPPRPERVARPSPLESQTDTPPSPPEKDVEPDLAQLLRELESDDRPHAYAAADSLLDLKTPAAEEALLEALARKPDSNGATAILEALARRPRTFQHWLPGIFDTDTVAGRAFDVLARAKGREFELVLAAALRSGSAQLHGHAVREVASRSPSRGARLFWRELMRSAARDDPDSRRDPEIFLRAALGGLSRSALGQLVRDVGRSNPTRSGRSRRRAAADPAPRLSHQGFAAALAASRVTEAWPLLEALLETRGPDLDVIRAAGRLGDSRALPVLERWLYLRDGRGEAVAEALGRLPGDDAVRLLLSAHAATLSVPGGLWPGFQNQVIRALVARRDEALSILVANCQTDPGRERAMASLTALFPDEAVAVLEDLLGDAPRRVRPLVAGALARLKTPEAIQVLVEALDDPALRRLARQSLRRVAADDFGPSPQAWKRWFENYSANTGKRTSGARPRHEARWLLVHHPTPRKEAL